MAFKPNIWNQLKSLTKGELIKALEADGWKEESRSATSGSIRAFLKPKPQGQSGHERVEIHYHKSSDTMGRGLLNDLLDDIGWTEADLIRLKLAKP